MPGLMQLISLIYGFLGFPLVTQIVIQSEAKDLKSVGMCIQIMYSDSSSLRSSEWQYGRSFAFFNTPPSPSQEGRCYLPHYLSSRAKRRISCTPTLCSRDFSGKPSTTRLRSTLFRSEWQYGRSFAFWHTPFPLSRGEILKCLHYLSSRGA